MPYHNQEGRVERFLFSGPEKANEKSYRDIGLYDEEREMIIKLRQNMWCQIIDGF